MAERKIQILEGQPVQGGQAGFLGPRRALPQPHARPVAVLLNENDAGGLEGAAECIDCPGLSRQVSRAGLEPLYRGERHTRCFGEISLLPSEQRSRGANLLACDQVGSPENRSR
jgi:hypothetical protein